MNRWSRPLTSNCQLDILKENFMSKEKEALDEFGKFLMQSVRDESIDVRNMILEGKMKGENAERIREFLGPIDNDVVSKI